VKAEAQKARKVGTAYRVVRMAVVIGGDSKEGGVS